MSYQEFFPQAQKVSSLIHNLAFKSKNGDLMDVERYGLDSGRALTASQRPSLLCILIYKIR
jgi:hypothetical protein